MLEDARLKTQNSKRETRKSKFETQDPEHEPPDSSPQVQNVRQGSATSRFVEWNLQKDVGMTCGGVVRLYFEVYNLATWPIVIFGAGHCGQALVRLLLTMQCQLTVIDPRREWLEKLPGGGEAAGAGGGKLRKILAERPMAEYVKDVSTGAFVLLMTMGHATDQPILIERALPLTVLWAER